MRTFELSTEETEFLTELLERRAVDLQWELGHTDSTGFKELLKQRKVLLEGLLARLRHVPVPC